MRREPPLRAEPDSRLLDQGDSQQGYLFGEPNVDQAEDQLLADYRQRYGLSEDPFSHDYSFPLFTGAGRRQLLDQLLHLCQFSNSVLTVHGEYSVGKTRIAHAFMDSLSDQDQICFLSLQSGHNLDQILLAIIQSFGIAASEASSTESLLASIEAFIAEEAVTEDDGLAVVVLDNAQLLDDHSIFVLTSLLHNFPQQNRLHLALFSEPQLIPRLDRLSPENLLINDFQLQPFGLLETVDYLNFRMEMADYLGPEIFTESMVEPWWRQTRGQLSQLHDLAQERLLESVTPAARSTKRPLPVVHIVAISMLIAAVGVVFLYMGDEDSSDVNNQPLATSTAVPALVPQPAPQPVIASSAPAAGTDRALTSTETPVEPLLQTLPQPLQPNQQVQSVAQGSPPVQAATGVVGEGHDDFPKEKVVPLAQLPTSQPQKVEAHSAATSGPVAQPRIDPAPSPTAQVPAKAVSEPVRPAVKPETMNASAQERSILAWKSNEFTVQLLGVSSEKAARDFVAGQANKSDLLVFKSKRQGKDWFVVITGRYASSAQARQAIANLPAAQRDAGPWPRDVKTIQSEIRAAM